MPDAVQLACDAGVEKVYLTHHEPTRSDEDLDAQLYELRKRQGNAPPTIYMAREGEMVEV